MASTSISDSNSESAVISIAVLSFCQRSPGILSHACKVTRILGSIAFSMIYQISSPNSAVKKACIVEVSRPTDLYDRTVVFYFFKNLISRTFFFPNTCTNVLIPLHFHTSRYMYR